MMPSVVPDAPSALERIVRRDRLMTVIGVAAMTVLAWLYLAREASSMQSMAMDARMHAAMGMADMHAWGAADWLALFVMWTVMMAGMMLPSAAPVILLVLAAYRRRADRCARASAAAFIGGYLLAWTTFSGLAAAVQVGLHRTALLTPEMASSSAKLAGAILLVAGVYQWLPIKNMCLTHCQSPLGFITRYWREGAVGGLRMGVRHGLFCVGCCWALMALLFVVGVMNLIWVAAIAGFVLVEKLAPQGTWLARVAGVLLIVWGAYVLVRPAFG
jgi:predicted metal-binding membrane protein